MIIIQDKNDSIFENTSFQYSKHRTLNHEVNLFHLFTLIFIKLIFFNCTIINQPTS